MKHYSDINKSGYKLVFSTLLNDSKLLSKCLNIYKTPSENKIPLEVLYVHIYTHHKKKGKKFSSHCTKFSLTDSTRLFLTIHNISNSFVFLKI